MVTFIIVFTDQGTGLENRLYSFIVEKNEKRL